MQKIGHSLLQHYLVEDHGIYICSNLTCVRTNNAAVASWVFFDSGLQKFGLLS